MAVATIRRFSPPVTPFPLPDVTVPQQLQRKQPISLEADRELPGVNCERPLSSGTWITALAAADDDNPAAMDRLTFCFHDDFAQGKPCAAIQEASNA